MGQDNTQVNTDIGVNEAIDRLIKVYDIADSYGHDSNCPAYVSLDEECECWTGRVKALLSAPGAS